MRIGIFDHMSSKLGGGQLVAAQMATQLSRQHEVDLIHSGEGYTLATLEKAFEVDLTRVNERILKDSHETFNLPGPLSTFEYLRHKRKWNRTLTEPYDLFIYSGHGVPPFSSARRGLVYCHFPFEGCPSETLGSIEQFKNKSPWNRWVRQCLYESVWKYRMRGYGSILANSSFTAYWIKQMWKKEAEVVYPPVSLRLPEVKKRNVIVSLGRFIDSHNSKNHVHQLKSFGEFLRQADTGWSLKLIGFCTLAPKEVAYLNEMRHLATGLPVQFIVNAERADVLNHLAEAKLFWHTAGMTDSEETTPSKMEHFGIATVEAMLAGCVPFAPAHGGQVEIVEHGLSGFLCRNTRELVEFSNLVACNQPLLREMSSRAVDRGKMFSREVFMQRIAQIVDRLNFRK